MNIFKKKKIKEKTQLEKDWGNPDIYGPWIKEDSNKLKYYKSYWFITTDKPANMEPLNIKSISRREKIKNIFKNDN